MLTDDPQKAEKTFQRGIAVAEEQEAKSLQLRCTVSLCRLWQQQCKVREARQLLIEIYNWFEEGFDTPDLQNAQAMLGELEKVCP